MGLLTLVVGNKNYSSWSLRPWFFLKKNNIDFQEINVPLYTASTYDKLRQFGTYLKVPILRDDKLVIWDSLSIMEYISSKYLKSTGWPSDENARAVARSISAEMHSGFPNLRSELPMNCRKKFTDRKVTDAAAQEIDRVKQIWRACRSEMGGQGKWLFGDFSIADAMYAPVALRFNTYGIPLDKMEEEYVSNLLSETSIQMWIDAAKEEQETIQRFEVET